MKVISAIFISLLVSLSAVANDRFYKPTEKVTFTYEEFRKLSPQHQEEWIKELRNFNRNLDLVLDGQRLTAKKPKYWSLLENINLKPLHGGICLLASRTLIPEPALAQDKSCFLRKEMRNKVPLICAICKSSGMELLNKCAPNDRKNPNTTAAEIFAKINSKDSKDARLAVSEEELTAHVKMINSTGYSLIDSAKLRPNLDVVKSTGLRTGVDIENSAEKARVDMERSAPTATVDLAVARAQATESASKPAELNVSRNPYELQKAPELKAEPDTNTPALTANDLKAYAERNESAAKARAKLESLNDANSGRAFEAARSRPNCQVSRRVQAGVREICMNCDGDAVSGVKVCSAEGNDSNTIAKELISNLSKKDYEGSKVSIDEKSLTEIIGVTKGEQEDVSEETRKRFGLNENLSEGAVAFKGEVVRKSVVTQTISTAGSSSPVTVTLPNNTQVGDFKDASAAGPRMTIEKRDENNKVVERAGNDPNLPAYKRRNLEDLGSRDDNESVDSDELTKTDRLACIYAGWAVENGSKCSPETEKTINDASGKKVTYSCKSGGTSSESIIYGDNPDGNTFVLCNPVIFGLVSGKPICIKKAKNATELCAGLAGPPEQTLKIAKQNPKEYRTLIRRISLLCQSDEEKLRAHFAKRGKSESQIKNAISDLSVTCQHLRTRMAQIVEANSKASPDAGTR